MPGGPCSHEMSRCSRAERSGPRGPDALVRRVSRVAALLVVVLAGSACTGSLRPGTPTPTAAPVVLATPVPTPTLTVTPVQPTPISPPTQASAPPEPAERTLYVTNTGGQGLTLRQAPGGTPLGSLNEDVAVTALGDEQREGDRLWRKVRDPEGREGWMAADFLTDRAPASPPTTAVAAPSPEPRPTASAEAPSPTWPVPLIPTATLRPPGSVPTHTPRPTLSPVPIVLPTPVPVIVPNLSATRPAAGPTRTPTR
jgi:hypothetical protein